MNARLLMPALLLLLSVSAWAAEPPDESDPKGGGAETAKFQGTWKPVSVTRNGQRLEPTEFDAMRLIVDENQYTFKGQKGDRHNGTFKIHAGKKPPVIETTYAEGSAEGKTVQRVYRWTDKDTLIICTPGPDETVPDNFEAPQGSGRDVITWKRVDE